MSLSHLAVPLPSGWHINHTYVLVLTSPYQWSANHCSKFHMFLKRKVTRIADNLPSLTLGHKIDWTVNVDGSDFWLLDLPLWWSVSLWPIWPNVVCSVLDQPLVWGWLLSMTRRQVLILSPHNVPVESLRTDQCRLALMTVPPYRDPTISRLTQFTPSHPLQLRSTHTMYRHQVNCTKIPQRWPIIIMPTWHGNTIDVTTPSRRSVQIGTEDISAS